MYDNKKDIGSLRCKSCNSELKDNEYVLCRYCEEQSITDEELEDFLKKFMSIKGK